MIAVAVVALLLGGEMMRRRRQRYREQADFHAFAEAFCARDVRMARATPPAPPGGTAASLLNLDGADRTAVEQAASAAAYHAAMKRKYERAARYPWLSVEPDPPPS
jgi:hypothetical protein